MKLIDIYESETGEKAIYRKGSSDFHTLKYVRWLEKRAPLIIQSSRPTDSFLGKMKKKEERLSQLLKDTWIMMEHATRIDFSNGNVHNGIDEGNVRGWEFYEDLRKKVKELGLL